MYKHLYKKKKKLGCLKVSLIEILQSLNPLMSVLFRMPYDLITGAFINCVILFESVIQCRCINPAKQNFGSNIVARSEFA